ncbi:hypothetical protein M8818_005040 [Zalaria obscura]|uniref:Uncharacterized protein n=1 Tax=Zalaria obscura TaxID=2024903 RepID=A0ACC3S9Y1_9PEZI
MSPTLPLPSEASLCEEPTKLAGSTTQAYSLLDPVGRLQLARRLRDIFVKISDAVCQCKAHDEDREYEVVVCKRPSQFVDKVTGVRGSGCDRNSIPHVALDKLRLSIEILQGLANPEL